MHFSIFAAGKTEKYHVGNVVSARRDIFLECTQNTITKGTKGTITDAHTSPKDTRLCILWEGQDSAVWCSFNDVIECLPGGS